MATLVTPEKIEAMSTEDRTTLYANCMRTVNNEDAISIVENLIAKKLKTQYNNQNATVTAAGFLIAKKLYALDFEKGPMQPMPEGTIARSGATFRKKPGYA